MAHAPRVPLAALWLIGRARENFVKFREIEGRILAAGQSVR